MTIFANNSDNIIDKPSDKLINKGFVKCGDKGLQPTTATLNRLFHDIDTRNDEQDKKIAQVKKAGEDCCKKNSKTIAELDKEIENLEKEIADTKKASEKCCKEHTKKIKELEEKIGDLKDDIDDIVEDEGGNINAFLRLTQWWRGSGDLDLHLHEPSGGEHIYFRNKSSATGGVLDVDKRGQDNVNASDYLQVENISYDYRAKYKEGEYKATFVVYKNAQNLAYENKPNFKLVFAPIKDGAESTAQFKFIGEIPKVTGVNEDEIKLFDFIVTKKPTPKITITRVHPNVIITSLQGADII